MSVHHERFVQGASAVGGVTRIGATLNYSSYFIVFT